MTMPFDPASEPHTTAAHVPLTPQGFASALQPRFLHVPFPRATVATTTRSAAVGAAGLHAASLTAARAEPERDRAPFALSLSEWIDIQVGMANLDRIAFTMRNIGADLVP